MTAAGSPASASCVWCAARSPLLQNLPRTDLAQTAPLCAAVPRHAEARTTQIRLVRIFRVFKFGRYSLGLQMFVGCLKASTQARAPSGRSSLHHLGLGLAFPKVTAWLI